jgi:hypothetical protein
MTNKPSLDYLGRVAGNIKKGVNPHTIKAEEIMVPKPVSSSNTVISFKINLD